MNTPVAERVCAQTAASSAMRRQPAAYPAYAAQLGEFPAYHRSVLSALTEILDLRLSLQEQADATA